MDRVERLTEQAHRLTALVDDPHPGLATWNIAVYNVLRDVADNLDAATLREVADGQAA